MAFDLVLKRKALVLEALGAHRHEVLHNKYSHLKPKLLELSILRRLQSLFLARQIRKKV
jgi:hypothetical protein